MVSETQIPAKLVVTFDCTREYDKEHYFGHAYVHVERSALITDILMGASVNGSGREGIPGFTGLTGRSPKEG